MHEPEEAQPPDEPMAPSDIERRYKAFRDSIEKDVVAKRPRDSFFEYVEKRIPDWEKKSI